MANDNNNVIDILFGVAGGSKIKGASGKLIKGTLDALAKEITVKVKVDADQEYFKKQLEQLKVVQKGSGVTITSPVDSATISSVDKLTKKIEEYYKLKNKVKNLELKGGQPSVEYQIEKRKLDELTKAFKENERVLKNTGKSGKQYAKVLATTSENQLNEKTVADAAKKLEEYYKIKKRLKDLEGRGEQAGTAYQTEKKRLDELTPSLEEYRNLLIKSGEAGEQYVKALKEAEGAERQASKLSIAKLHDKASSLYVTNGFDKVIARSREAKALVDAFNKKVKALGDGATKGQVDSLNEEFIKTETRLREIQKETDTAGLKIMEAFGSKIIQTFAAVLSGFLLSALKKVYTNVVNLDKAVTNLQIATGYTREETKALISAYGELAQQIGATVTEVADAADTWLRQGYSVEEANELIVDSMMLSKLGQIESTEASTALTSAMKGYKLEVADAVGIVDKLTAVDMAAAVSAGDIATAMEETAASAEVSGVSMDKLIGYIATVSEVTQDGAESVGTFYKTLFARMGNIKAGVFVDDETGESFNDVEKVLGELGISLRDSNDSFRDFDDVLGDVAKSWDAYTDVQKHALATAFAGTRQQEKFIVLMENYGDALNYATTAANSAGTAQRKYNEAYLDSIEAKLNELTALWENFSTLILNSELIKLGADILIKVVGFLNKIVAATDGLIVSIPVIAVALAALYSTLLKIKETTVFLTIWNGIKGVLAILPALGTALQSVILSIYAKVAAHKASTIALIEETAATEAATAAQEALNAVSPVAWIILAATVLTALYKVIKKAISAEEDARKEAVEAAKTAKEAWEEVINQLAEVENKLNEVNERVAELQELSANGSITLVEQEELDKLQNSVKLLEAEKDALEEQAEEKKQIAVKSASYAMTKILGEKLNYTTLKKEYGIKDWGARNKTTEAYADEILGDWENATDEQKEYVFDFYDRLKEQKDVLDEYYTGDNLEQWQVDANKAYDAYWKNIHKFMLSTGSSLGDVWESILAMDKFAGAEDAFKKLANGAGASVESLKALYDSDNAVKTMIDYLIELGQFTWDDSEKVKGLVNQINALKDVATTIRKITFLDVLNDGQKEFDALSDALGDIEKQGILSADSISKILESYPDLEKFFELTTDGYKLKSDYAGMSTADILREYAESELQPFVDELAKCEEGTENYAIAQENLNTAIAGYATLLHSAVLEERQAELEEEKDALEEQLDNCKSLIDIRKDLLSTYKEELEYQKELSQKQNSVADLKTQLALAQLDNSAAGQARVRELQEELDSAEEELNDFTLERAISELTSELDDSYDEYQKLINTEVDRIVDEIDSLKSSLNIKLTAPDATGSGGSSTGASSGARSGKGAVAQDLKIHHKGGFVGDGSVLKSNEEFAKLLNGELVVTPTQMDNFMKKTLPAIGDSNRGVSIEYNSPLIEIKCGKIDESTLPELDNIVNKAVTKIKKDMKDALSRTGYRKPI